MDNKPLALEKRHPDRVLLMNAFAVRSRRWTFAMGNCRCTAVSSPAVPAFEKRATVRLEINGRPFELALGGIDFLTAHPLFDDPALADAPIDECPEELQSAIAQKLLEPLMDGLVERLGVEAVFVSYAAAFPGERCVGTAVGFTVLFETQGRPLPPLACALVPVGLDSAREAQRVLQQTPPTDQGDWETRLARIPLRLSVCGGEQKLTAPEYDALQAGDVVLLSRWLLQSQEVLLVVASADKEVLRCRGTYGDGVVRLSEELPETKEEPMVQSDELTINLTFELESRTMTVADLKHLSPGYTFRLAVDAAAPVTVRANGRAVAKGRLVDVNGTIGVELVEDPTGEAGAKDGL